MAKVWQDGSAGIIYGLISIFIQFRLLFQAVHVSQIPCRTQREYFGVQVATSKGFMMQNWQR